MKRKHITLLYFRGQTSLVVMLLLLVVLAGAALFLISLAQTISQDEYINLFTHQFLLSTLRAGTGYSDPACRTVGETASCAFFSPGYACNNQVPCTEVVRQKVEQYAAQVGLARQNFRYLITIESEGFIARAPSGEPFRIEIGDQTLKRKTGKRYAANERLQAVLPSGVVALKATIIVAPRG